MLPDEQVEKFGGKNKRKRKKSRKGRRKTWGKLGQSRGQGSVLIPIGKSAKSQLCSCSGAWQDPSGPSAVWGKCLWSAVVRHRQGRVAL